MAFLFSDREIRVLDQDYTKVTERTQRSVEGDGRPDLFMCPLS